MGARSSTAASTACAAWSASTTTASASAPFVRKHPELQGAVTDLLIGDLFTDAADRVWGPMDALAGADKQEIAPWHAGPAAPNVPTKANVLMKPEGVR